ncbi:Mrp/NBP35 family ATP-binding protein [Desulfoluna sp.]|uniref:Mrp/NBP35 family ATP-binding protein n=1 Tax=Desulfoluna sp. TaxID=2045199 RepID=UPI002622A0DA|nr:Mrp/NBP35 family ATP-binding protein [Desulfoluna sp.]
MIHDSVDKAKKAKGGKSDAAQEQERMIKGTLSKIKNKLFVMSGKGGVGKSSISANLAVGLAEKGFKVGLMDVDLHGPSIAQIMGLSELLDINEEKKLIPAQKGPNLKVITMQCLMREADQAVIWRGPAKAGMIQQFVTQVEWGELDFLVIDAPPGTGDEPLTVVQTIPEAKAIVVTTPQEVALADVRKSINFCQTVKLDVVGLVENMGPFTCPGCNTKIALFKSGGGLTTATKMGIPFLGTIPFDPAVVEASDAGTPIFTKDKNNEFSVAIETIIAKIVKQL